MSCWASSSGSFGIAQNNLINPYVNDSIKNMLINGYSPIYFEILSKDYIEIYGVFNDIIPAKKLTKNSVNFPKEGDKYEFYEIGGLENLYDILTNRLNYDNPDIKPYCIIFNHLENLTDKKSASANFVLKYDKNKENPDSIEYATDSQLGRIVKLFDTKTSLGYNLEFRANKFLLLATRNSSEIKKINVYPGQDIVVSVNY